MEKALGYAIAGIIFLLLALVMYEGIVNGGFLNLN